MNILLEDKLETLFENLPVSLYWKEKNGNYARINHNFLAEYHTFSEDDILGRNDVDLWKGNAPLFHINDKKVMFYEKKEIFTESHLYNGIQRYYLSFKNPWYSKLGKLIGTYGASILINPGAATKTLTTILNLLHQNHYENGKSKLTDRQKECVCYLAKGMTFKQIAKNMGLSSKTIEHYLEIAKQKLNCTNRYELIRKAFELGFV